MPDGLHARAFLALARALTEAMPETFAGRPLTYVWCFKSALRRFFFSSRVAAAVAGPARYDSDYEGIKVHADEAAVNVNLWLTPDAANLDPASGGLVIYTAKPGDAATVEDYNARGDEFARDLLEATGYANVTVPYRQNRIVLFDGALFHRTDRFRFRKGYENRRINLTLLFGAMRRGGVEVTGPI